MAAKSDLLAKRHWSLEESIFASKLMVVPGVSITDSATENGCMGSRGTCTLSFSYLERLRFTFIRDGEEDIFFLRAHKRYEEINLFRFKNREMNDLCMKIL